MASVIHTSDGRSVHVELPASFVIRDFAKAFRLADGTMLPKGFIPLDTTGGTTEYVNVAQIVRVVDE